MIDQTQERQSQHQENQKVEKIKGQDDDTLSLESDRSQGFINERMNDWPSWTIDENEKTINSEQTMKDEQGKQNLAIPNVGIVNEEEIKQAKQKLIEQIRIPKKRYGRSALRFQRLRIEKQQNLARKNIPVYDATSTNGTPSVNQK